MKIITLTLTSIRKKDLNSWYDMGKISHRRNAMDGEPKPDRYSKQFTLAGTLYRRSKFGGEAILRISGIPI